MKILLFSSTDFSTASGSGIRGRLICEGLIDQGHQVFIVCKAIPSHFLEIGAKFISTDVGIDKALEDAMNDFKPDITYGITEGFADIVQKKAKFFGCTLAFDLHGIGIFEIIELGSGYGSQLARIKDSARWLWSIRKADIITVANPTLVSLVSFFYGKQKVFPIIGITDIDHFSPAVERVKLGSDATKLQILYAGNYYKWQGVDLFLDAIQQLLSEGFDAEFTILGSIGKDHFIFDRYRNLLAHPQVHFIDYVKYEDAAAFYQGADVLLIPRRWMLSTYFAFPQKIVDYLASGRLIIATNISPHKWILQDPECGILCPPTVKGLSTAINKSMSITLRNELSSTARNKAISLFDFHDQTKKICRIFENIKGNK